MRCDRQNAVGVALQRSDWDRRCRCNGVILRLHAPVGTLHDVSTVIQAGWPDQTEAAHILIHPAQLTCRQSSGMCMFGTKSEELEPS